MNLHNYIYHVTYTMRVNTLLGLGDLRNKYMVEQKRIFGKMASQYNTIQIRNILNGVLVKWHKVRKNARHKFTNVTIIVCYLGVTSTFAHLR